MKRLSFSFFTIAVLSFMLVQSCSTDEENTVAPIVQTPEPEGQVKHADGVISNCQFILIHYLLKKIDFR